MGRLPVSPRSGGIIPLSRDPYMARHQRCRRLGRRTRGQGERGVRRDVKMAEALVQTAYFEGQSEAAVNRLARE